MHAEIRTVKDPSLRVQIVEQRADFDTNPTVFRKTYGDKQKELTDKIIAARALLKDVRSLSEALRCRNLTSQQAEGADGQDHRRLRAARGRACVRVHLNLKGVFLFITEQPTSRRSRRTRSSPRPSTLLF